ncbi:MAG: hypothetical protein KJ579_11235, partial [Verrucomicrobia bacterium]|nr:hypothetical protein [Verrucomicrobiota bacterium]
MKSGLGGLLLGVICLSGVSGALAGTNDKPRTATMAAADSTPVGWVLVWEDDFAGPQLDSSKWELCKRGGSDWNDTMSDDPRLLKIENGVLHLRGMVNDRTDTDSAPHLTAGVTSKGKFAF